MAHRCWLETKKAERLFHDLLECYQDEHAKRLALEEELHAKPEEPNEVRAIKTANCFLEVARNTIGEISEQLDIVESRAVEARS